MTAAEYVALAKRAASDAWPFLSSLAYVRTASERRYRDVLCVKEHDRKVWWIADSTLPPSDAVLLAPLTPENTASEDALVRALLASAIHVERTRDGYVHAVLADDGYIGDDEVTVRADLLDALLAPPVHYKECGDAPNLCGKPGYDGGFWTPRRDRSSEARVTCVDCRALLAPTETPA